MLHDLLLKNEEDTLLGIAKIDISNDETNIAQKQVSLNFITKAEPPFSFDTEDVTAFELEQEKVERFIQPKNYLMSDLLSDLTDIDIVAEFDGEELNPVPTTTTTTAAPTTTTTTAG